MAYADTVCIILNYNDALTTKALAKRLHTYKNIDKIIIVDNASTDDSLSKLSELVGERTVLIRGERNGGYGYGNNLGLQYASKVFHARYALIANPDTAFSEKVIDSLKDAFSKDKNIAAASPLMCNKNCPPSRFEYGGRKNVISGATAWPLRPWLYDLIESAPIMRRLFYRILHYNKDFYKKSGIVSVGAVAGALLMLDIEKALHCGGYDERVFLYCEENILGRRLRDYGYKTVLLTKVSYKHIHAKSIKKTFAGALERQRLRERASLIYYGKYLHINPLQYILTKVVFKIVELEIVIFGLFSGYR